jgi:hypothetical protein
MEKYKVCPYCGTHNPPKMLECIQCETDLSNVRVIDNMIEQKEQEKASDSQGSSVEAKMIRLCDCGTHNPVNSRKCINCGEDISDIVPTPKTNEEISKCVFASLDGMYAYEVCEPEVVIGREEVMNEYLAAKTYVSRRHAIIKMDADHFYIKNLSQTNFTYVNNVKIPDGDYELHDGDEIGVGGNSVNGKRQEEAAYFQVRIGSCI